VKRIQDLDFSRTKLIINPSRYPQYVKLLKKTVGKANFAAIVESESREHFIQSVREFREGPLHYLLVWGGDGTAHDTINTLLENEKGRQLMGREKAVGFLRGGSGNGIQDSYEVPFSLKRQLRAYSESTRNGFMEAVDLFEIRYSGRTEYGQLAGLGFDVKVLELRNERKKLRGKHAGYPKPGLLNYARSTLKAFFRHFHIPEAYSIDLYDGRYSYRGYRVNAEFPFEQLRRDTTVPMLEIGTRPYYGHLFKVCPDVVCNNGKVDLYLFNFFERFFVLKNAYLLWRGEHGKINKKLIRKGKPVIERYQVREVRISRDSPFYFHIDGELRQIDLPNEEGVYEIRVNVIPRVINFIVPGTFYRKFHPDFSE